MQTQRINITLPKTVLKQLQSEIPKGARSQFIAKAVSEKLKKRGKRKLLLTESLKINKEFYKKEYEVWKPLETEGWPD